MMKSSSLKAAYLKQRAGLSAGARNVLADDYEEEFDEIESLPFDPEHDEDDRDPEPERRPSPEHAQGRRSGHLGRSSERSGKIRI
jgi:hypothetical protein